MIGIRYSLEKKKPQNFKMVITRLLEESKWYLFINICVLEAEKRTEIQKKEEPGDIWRNVYTAFSYMRAQASAGI